MNAKPLNLLSLIISLSCAALYLGVAVQAQTQTTGPSGTWKWSIPGRNGGPDREFNLKLKADADKLTGILTPPGRGDTPGTGIEIKDGKIKGDEISFTIARPGRDGGDPVVTKYSGKVSGNTIEGKIQAPDRDGTPQTARDWKAERKVEP